MESYERLSNYPPEFFAKLSDDELEKRREETETELASHKCGRFPDYRAIRCLEGDRDAITHELRKRGKLVSPGASKDEGFLKQIEASRKALENAQQALNPSPDASSTPDSPKSPKPHPRVHEQVRSVSAVFTGHLSHSMATRVPHDPPVHFPSDLWPQTYLILLEAQKVSAQKPYVRFLQPRRCKDNAHFRRGSESGKD